MFVYHYCWTWKYCRSSFLLEFTEPKKEKATTWKFNYKRNRKKNFNFWTFWWLPRFQASREHVVELRGGGRELELEKKQQMIAKPGWHLMLSVLVQLQVSRVKLCRYLLAVMWRGVVTIKVVVLVVILTTLKEIALLRKSSAWRKRGIRYSWDGVATCICFENR